MGKQIKGILGTKLGMTQVFNDAGQIVPVTVVQAGPCVVTAVRTPGTDGYSAVQLGFGEIDPRKVTKPVSGRVREGRPDPAPVPGRAADRRRVGIHARAGSHRRGVRQRAARRRDRQEQGQGHRGRHEAARLQGAQLLARHPAQAPLARLHRRVRDPGPGVQGRADGGPDGRRADHRAVAHRARRRRRARAAPDQGRGARPERPCRARPQRGQDRNGRKSDDSTSASSRRPARTARRWSCPRRSSPPR